MIESDILRALKHGCGTKNSCSVFRLIELMDVQTKDVNNQKFGNLAHYMKLAKTALEEKKH